MTNDAFIDVFVMQLDSDPIAIVEIGLRSVGDMGVDYDLCYQVAIWLRSERIATELYARQ